MATEVDPQQRFALQVRNVHLGWLALAISWTAAAVAAIYDLPKLVAIALFLGLCVFRITQHNRLDQRGAVRSWSDRALALLTKKPKA